MQTFADRAARVKGKTPETVDSREDRRQVALAQGGDERALEWLCVRYRAAVWRWARQYERSTQTPVEDLVQEGYLGLLEAVKSFDPARDTKFATWALTKIRGAILENIRDYNSVIQRGRCAIDRGRVLKASRLAFETRMGRAPNQEEMSEETGVPVLILRGHESIAYVYASLEQRVGGGNPSLSHSRGSEVTLEDTISDPDAVNALALAIDHDEQRLLCDALAEIPERWRCALLLWAGGLTWRQVGVEMGVSESRVYQLGHQAVKQVRVILARCEMGTQPVYGKPKPIPEGQMTMEADLA